MKQNIAVFFGGRSVEHEVSIVTGLQLIENIDKAKYEVTPVYIAPNGKWYTGEKLLSVDCYKSFEPSEHTAVTLSPCPADMGGVLTTQAKGGFFGKKSENIYFDCAIPAMHGLGGEDGTLQGLFELANVPYAETGVLGSAAGMDKIVMKTVFAGMGLKTLPYLFFTTEKWLNHRQEVIEEIKEKIDFPIFVKPSNLGSSIGINKATTLKELEYAINTATQYDRRILVEQGVDDITEINCSALGFGDDVKASVCEQPISWQSFLSFEDKYLRGGKSQKNGMESLSRKLPAPIPAELSKQIQGITVEIFKMFDCKGVVRIDYIFDNASQTLYVNEINTIPGSFAFYLWDYEGLSYSKLIDKLILQALEAHEAKNRNKYAFDSEILNKANIVASAKSAKIGK